MADTITLTSTTNTEAELRNALGVAQVSTSPSATEPTLPLEPDAVEEAAAEAAAPTPSSPQVAGGKKRGRLQSRIDELVDERNRIRGETAAQGAELEALRRRVSELVGAGQLGPRGAEPEPVAAKGPDRPKVEDFGTYEEYTEAVADWKVETKTAAIVEARLAQERKAGMQAQQQASKIELQRRYAQAEVAVKDKYADYADVVSDPNLKASDVMVDQMLLNDNGPEIAYYLAKHPDECRKLYALGNSPAALKAFGKIEARVEDALAAAATPTANGGASGKSIASVASPAGRPAVVTRAPDPISPVGAGAQGTTVDPATMSYQDYREYRNAQEWKRMGRR